MKHEIDYNKIAEGLGIPLEDCKEFFNDGRIMGRLAEFVYAQKTGGWRCDSENSPFDVHSKDGDRVEVRSITKNGVSFASSKEVGYGRSVTKQGYAEKLDSLDYYACVDFSDMNTLNFIEVDKEFLNEIENSGIMRKNKSVNMKKFLNFVGDSE